MDRSRILTLFILLFFNFSFLKRVAEQFRPLHYLFVIFYLYNIKDYIKILLNWFHKQYVITIYRFIIHWENTLLFFNYSYHERFFKIRMVGPLITSIWFLNIHLSFFIVGVVKNFVHHTSARNMPDGLQNRRVGLTEIPT